jgi:hypothetical protein
MSGMLSKLEVLFLSLPNTRAFFLDLEVIAVLFLEVEDGHFLIRS